METLKNNGYIAVDEEAFYPTYKEWKPCYFSLLLFFVTIFLSYL